MTPDEMEAYMERANKRMIALAIVAGLSLVGLAVAVVLSFSAEPELVIYDDPALTVEVVEAP